MNTAGPISTLAASFGPPITRRHMSSFPHPSLNQPMRAHLVEAEGKGEEYQFQFPMRPIIEHIVLYKTRPDLTPDQEKDMLDNLYTTQYQIRTVLSISLGKIYSKKNEGFTHAMVIRFPSRKELGDYLSSAAYFDVLEKFVTPVCEDSLSVSYEGEVEDDIETIFRRGEDFESGVEHIVLVRLKAESNDDAARGLLESLRALPLAVGDSVMQLTTGENFSDNSQGFTHGLVVRLPSEEDLALYNRHPAHRNMLRRHLLSASERVLAVDFRVDPVSEPLRM